MRQPPCASASIFARHVPRGPYSRLWQVTTGRPFLFFLYVLPVDSSVCNTMAVAANMFMRYSPHFTDAKLSSRYYNIVVFLLHNDDIYIWVQMICQSPRRALLSLFVVLYVSYVLVLSQWPVVRAEWYYWQAARVPYASRSPVVVVVSDSLYASVYSLTSQFQLVEGLSDPHRRLVEDPVGTRSLESRYVIEA